MGEGGEQGEDERDRGENRSGVGERRRCVGENFTFVLFVFRRSSREWHAMGELDS